MNFKDVELLSVYLDGQLSPSDFARLETRLKSDPGLASALDALRESRALLRRLPRRRAPRNFTLTPALVGKKPPLPRSYPAFRFATALAALLFVFSFITNEVTQLAASAPVAEYGIGGGGGGDGESVATEPPMVQMAPAATEVPAYVLTLEAALVTPTATPEATDDQQRLMEPTASAKDAGEPAPGLLNFPSWTTFFGIVALLGAASMFTIQRLAARKWRGK